MGKPLVSIVVPTFNRVRFLRQTILSLLAEKDVSTEIWVVDDASEDDSMDSIRDLPVGQIRLEKNRGVSRARNEGLSVCQGELVTFFDSDDLLVPGGISRRAKALLALPSAVGVGGTQAGDIDADGNLLPHRVQLPPKEPLTLDFFRRGGVYCLGPWLYLFRRKALEEAGGFDETLQLASDSDLMFRLLGSGYVPVLPIPVMLYRFHEGNLSFSDAERPAMRPRALAETYLVNAQYGIPLRS